jgi:hypothetical protein
MTPLLRFLAPVVGVLIFLMPLYAIEKNGIQLTAQKTTLEKDKNPDQFYQWDKVNKALALKVTVRNNSLKDLEPATLEYTVIVQKWGHNPKRYKNVSGKEPLPALARGKIEELTVGKVQLDGWETSSNRKEFMDSIDAWQVRIIGKDGQELIVLKSGTSYETLAAKAK